MSFPCVRLTIARAEYELLKPGLDLIACQLANAKLGLQTRRHPLDRIDLQLSDIYKRKQYSEEGDQAVISVRAKLWELTSSRKIRANFLELSAAALALRVLRRLPNSNYDPIAAKALAAKLERYRKRAKRAAISRLGTDQYATAADRCQCFVQWIRYYLIYLHQPKRCRSSLLCTWAYQRSALAELIASILHDFGYAPLSDTQMKRVVRLIKEELRRRRHPISLMELLRSKDPVDRQFLFHVVAKKCELSPLPGVRYPMCVAAAARGEKFKNRSLRRTCRLTKVSATSAQGDLGMQNPPSPQSSDQSSPTSINLVAAIAYWFREYVDPAQWEAVGSRALTAAIFNPLPHVIVPPAASLADLISKTRPATRFGTSCYPDHVRDLAIWLLRWLNGCHITHAQVIVALRAGYRFAVGDRNAQAA
jgi:hypothetical protein